MLSKYYKVVLFLLIAFTSCSFNNEKIETLERKLDLMQKQQAELDSLLLIKRDSLNLLLYHIEELQKKKDVNNILIEPIRIYSDTIQNNYVDLLISGIDFDYIDSKKGIKIEISNEEAIKRDMNLPIGLEIIIARDYRATARKRFLDYSLFNEGRKYLWVKEKVKYCDRVIFLFSNTILSSDSVRVITISAQGWKGKE